MTSEDFLASVFISYQHADKKLAAGLQDDLEQKGYFVSRDEGELRAGDSIVERVSAALDQIDFVVALVSSSSVTSPWCQKELSLAMTGEIARNGVRPIPVKRRPPFSQAHPESQPAPDAPIRVTGVDEKGMGVPRNDGTRGSALYLMPLRLSRRPSQGWATYFERTWNGNLFSTMHRPGIASIAGDRILLDGTTVEEVAQYHLSTVRQVVEEANRWKLEARAAEQREQQRRANAEVERQERICATLDGLKFD